MVHSSDIFNLILDLENPNWSTLPSNRVISKGYSVPVKRCSLCNVLMALYTKNAKQKKYCDGCRIYVTKRRLHRGYSKINVWFLQVDFNKTKKDRNYYSEKR